MSLLLSPIPLLYRWLAIAALVLAFGAFCGFKGYSLGIIKLHDAQVASLKEGGRIAAVRSVVTEKVVTKWLPQIERQHVITETIVKEVSVYVATTDPDLSPGFRVLHDAAAAGRVPDPADIGHAAPVPAADAARTITQNYGLCRADQLKLGELQEWVREQGKVR